MFYVSNTIITVTALLLNNPFQSADIAGCVNIIVVHFYRSKYVQM